jgi:uncharacterized protein YjiS (DUF1127 family)
MEPLMNRPASGASVLVPTHAFSATGNSPWQWLVGCLRRRRQRIALGELDDRLLADIGLSKASARREQAKRIWRP